jgi:hypothetical protein
MSAENPSESASAAPTSNQVTPNNQFNDAEPEAVAETAEAEPTATTPHSGGAKPAGNQFNDSAPTG